jgi:hypothetical protein
MHVTTVFMGYMRAQHLADWRQIAAADLAKWTSTLPTMPE